MICTVFHCRTSIITQQENLFLYQKFISRFTHTLIIVSDCFLIFWFLIKENQVLLVSIELLFSYCVKYVEIRAFSDLYFPVCGQNRIFISLYLHRISDSVQIRENTDQRKPLFCHISCSILLNIFSHNLDLRKNKSFVSAQKLFVVNI